MASGRVTVVIVTHNSRDVVGNALRGAKEAYDTGLVGNCVVIDNRSADGTAQAVRRDHPWCTVIENAENAGFARACNIGIEQAQSPYVLLLNPDASIPGWALQKLVDFLDRVPRAGAVAPAVSEPNGVLQSAGGLLTPRALLLEALGRERAYVDRRPIAPGAPAFRTSWVCGAVVLVRKTMLDRVGAFDPRYFLYFEETDLWLRAQRGGWEVWALGEAVATHQANASARKTGLSLYNGCIAEHYFRSRFHYMAENFGFVAAFAAEVVELAVMSLRAALRTVRGESIHAYWTRVGAPVLRRPAQDSGL